MEDYPADINVIDFANARFKEFSQMIKQSRSIRTEKVHPFQLVPRHLRRRAAAHNVKRLPKRIRKLPFVAKAYPEKDDTKKRSRRYRRKPSNLRDEFKRRQLRINWLATHLWHAKRFHMKEIWGYKLPEFSNEKSVRASYRAVRDSCLVIDFSYYGCICIEGKKDEILTGLMKLHNPMNEFEFGNHRYVSGVYWGTQLVYKISSTSDYQLIGPVDFIWNKSSEQIYEIYIWTHPSMHDELMAQLKDKYSESTSLHQSEIVEENIFKIGTIIIRNLKHEFSRFRLIGPETKNILQKICKPYEKDLYDPYSGLNEIIPKLSSNDVREKQNDILKSFSNLSLNSSNETDFIVAGIVHDPRFFLPPKKLIHSTMEDSNDTGNLNLSISSDVSRSLLWNTQIRNHVINKKPTTNEINTLRSENTYPGCTFNFQNNDVWIPLVIVNKQETSSYDCCDLIIPYEWGMPFWISLVYNGCRVGGLRELESVNLEYTAPLFPNDYPDSIAGSSFHIRDSNEMIVKIKAVPKAKQTLFCKKNHPYDFVTALQSIEDNKNNAKPNHNELKKNENNLLTSSNHHDQIQNCGDISLKVIRNSTMIAQINHFINDFENTSFNFHEVKNLLTNNSSYLHVCIRMLSKGIPTRYSLVHLHKESESDGITDENVDVQNHKIGFIVNGNYSFRYGVGMGKGYVSCYGLLKCFGMKSSNHRLTVSVNTPKSNCHRLGYILKIL